MLGGTEGIARITRDDSQIQLAVHALDLLDRVLFLRPAGRRDTGDRLLVLRLLVHRELVVRGDGKIPNLSHTLTAEQWRRLLAIFSGLVRSSLGVRDLRLEWKCVL